MKFDGSWWKIYPGWVYSTAVDAEGIIWFGKDDGKVCKTEGPFPTLYTYTLDDTWRHNSVFSIAIDSEGNKWFGTKRFGVSVLDKNNRNWTTYDESNSGLPCNAIRSLAYESSGVCWFGTDTGVASFDGNSWSSFDQENSGLVGNYVNYIAIDTQGNEWFATTLGISNLIEKDIYIPQGKVEIRGGPNGYVNPAIGESAQIYFNAEDAGTVKIKIFTITGSFVWEASKETDGNNDSVTWDCKNSDNNTVASGVYIVYTDGPGIDSIEKIPVLK